MFSFFHRLIHSPIYRLVAVSFVLLLASSALTSQNQGSVTPAAAVTPSYRAGGVSIAIPPPENDLVELGNDNRVLAEVFAPDVNRLLAAFILPEEFQHFKNGGDTPLSRYSLVEVLRRAEFMDLSEKNFNDATNSIAQQTGTVVNSTVKESEEEINRKVKALSPDDTKITLDKPVMLGRFFSKPNAYGLGMIMPVSKKGGTTKMVTGLILLRVKNRMLFDYVYAAYKDQETVKWVQKTSEDWADAILKANEQ